MACYAGFLSEKDSRRITSRAKVKSYLTDHGLAVFPVSEPAPGLLLPSYLAAMVIDGLVRYGKFDQADQLFQNHFLKDLGKGPSDQGSRSCCSTSRITELAPTALFLRLHGLMKLSNRELVIRHYDGKQPPVTVQYNQLELLLKHHLTEIHLQSGEVLYLNQPGTSRITLE
jgi:pentatricopeptide repeat protein